MKNSPAFLYCHGKSKLQQINNLSVLLLTNAEKVDIIVFMKV